MKKCRGKDRERWTGRKERERRREQAKQEEGGGGNESDSPSREGDPKRGFKKRDSPSRVKFAGSRVFSAV